MLTTDRDLTVAVVQPPCTAVRPAENALVHAEAVRRASARLVVFPEMSLTGYELDAPVVPLDDDAWAPIVAACAESDSLALVGAPVAGDDGQEHIATVAVSGTGVAVAYRKAWPGGAEVPRFSPGPGPVVLELDGWRIGLGICRDTGIAEHISATAALGVDLFAAGLADVPQDLPVQRQRARTIARTCRAHVAFASFAGSTGSGYEQTAGGSAIYSPQGDIVAESGPRTGAIARATIG